MHLVKTKELGIFIPSCFLSLYLWPIIKGCEIGFVESGSGCEPCRFLYYCNGCQMKCDCLEKDCHHVYGCENVSAEKSSVSPQTIESGSIVATGTTDEIRSKAESNTIYFKTPMICESMKRTATKRPFLFAVIGVAVVALLTTASYTYITMCTDQPKGPNKIELIV
uniref:Uncharacterized protein LOC111110797 isoform X1 n=1 Tax=Crassostrea virginica TaxID=6565 RepID=A0A8B8BIL5_CRAVI|nr:uncharacterized protein LOC111110797 isoform X1 [Crassostrea virginica]